MIKCLIIDDEKPAREELKYLIGKNSDFEIVGEGENGIDAVNLINAYHPDVVFCDINMPLLNGVDLAKALIRKGIQTQLIFVTAYDEYAIEAFELSALDYLLKPIKDERFERTIEKVRERLEERQSNLGLMDQLFNDYNKTAKAPNQLCLYREGLLYPVKREEVVYIHTEDKMVYFHTYKGVFESTKALSEIEDLLPESDFFKCHRSYIVNINCIESVIPWFNRTYRIKLEGIEEEIPVSRKQTNKLKERFNIL
jgi:two-component system LytT family response regulator/two-component system response regulator LytT